MKHWKLKSKNSVCWLPVVGFVTVFSTLGISKSLANTIRLEGKYFVPTQAGDSEAVIRASEFEVTYRLRSRPGRAPQIKYDIPHELTGGHVDIEMSPASSFGGAEKQKWIGSLTEGECSESTKGSTCTLTYPKSIVDFETAKRLIEQSTTDPAERTAKIQVLTRFSGEPIGVLDFSAPLPRPQP